MRIHFFKLLAAVCFAVLFQPAAVAADDFATREEGVAFVKKAVAYIKQNGKEKAFADFSDRNGQFIERELYIVVLDMNGVVLANGANPKLAGKSLLDIKDVNGKAFVREEIELAKTKGKGWVDFEWVNPVTKALEPRSTYFERVDDTIVLTGVYRRR